MRVNFQNRIETQITSPGGELTNPLLLAYENVETLSEQLVRKSYVDTLVSAHSLNATVHLTSQQKTLLDGITVTNTVMNFLTGVSSNVQTQLNNKANISNPSLTGALTLAADPVSGTQLATKSYTDVQITAANATVISGGTLPVGAIMVRPNITTPTGYLRANGAEISRTTYSALFNVIGDTYSFSTHPGSGQPWRQQYDINLTGDALGAWVAGTSLPSPLAHTQVILTKNRVYLLGGYNGTVWVTTVYTAPINADGTLGAWATATALPGILGHSTAIVTKNRVYLLGGYNGIYTATVYTAPINADGTLGTWVTGTSLPGVLGLSHGVVTNNRVYLIGGYTGSVYSSTVYTAPINADGTLGAWATGTSLPVPVGSGTVIITKNRVYLLGGYNGSTYTSTVYTAPINSDGTLGAWTTAASLPGLLSQHQSIVTRNRVYLLSGYNGSGYVATIYTAPINADGTLGAWTTTISLPGALGNSQVIVTSSRIYLLGGRITNTNWAATVYTAPISGGLNDYSPYYDGTYVAIDPANFKLPNLSNLETVTYGPSTSSYFIKF